MKPKTIMCINLKSRKDKKKFMVKQAKKMNINIKFFKAKLHNNPERGCLESHMSVIQQNKSKDNIMILEDDATFLRTFNNDNELPEPPTNWDILYLGGTIKGLAHYSEHWNKVIECWSTVGYIIKNTLYDKVISDLIDWDGPIDQYFVQMIQPNFNCFVLKDILIKQKDGYSDIQKQNVDYSSLNTVNTEPYKMVSHSIKDGDFVLSLDENIELPPVSIITITYNRRKFVPLMVHNFEIIEYPNHLLEWIILDDGNEPIKDLLPKDPRIKYIHMDVSSKLPIGKKRNYANNYASGEYILHFDDDDIYFKWNVMSRVKAMITNNKDCIGITKLPCISVINKTGFTVGNEYSVLSEASMGYKRSFWETRKFNEKVFRGEGVLFLKDREHNVVQLPYFFVMLALSHQNNTTGNLRTIEITPESKNAYAFLLNTLDPYTLEYIKTIG